MRALLVHHDANSRPGLIGEALDARGVDSVNHQVCLLPGSPSGTAVFPEPVGFDLVVLFGSRWSVYEEQVSHWVDPELDFVRAADRAGVPVLGLCFGGQVLAAALGGDVAPAPVFEVGWMEVEPVDPEIEGGPWLQWHFDAFTVPPGARELARSNAGSQAFRRGSHLGLQFHPEADRGVLESWMADDLDQLVAAGLAAETLLADADRHLVDARGRAQRLLDTVLERSG